MKFSKNFKDKKAIALINQLLNKKNPECRMGGVNFDALKSNPWFCDINWVLFHKF